MDIQSLLAFAVKHGISDVHIKVGRPPYFRKNGVMVTQKGVPDVSARQAKGWLESVSTDATRASFARELEADFAYSCEAGRFRVNAFRQSGAIGMVLRHIPTQIPTLASLALPDSLGPLALNMRGLVLVTGATGSGKSTTLAAMVQHINAQRPCHILTIEDPIEFNFSDDQAIINQREVGRDTQSFPKALRAALRQDPDVILIGELRDLETVETALHAAETGHLVLSTLHTVDAMETIGRVIGLFPPHQQDQIRLQLSTILRGVVSQRLVRSRSGGRSAVCEVLIGSELIRQLIADANRTHEIPMVMKQSGQHYGMQTFDQALYALWKEGKIAGETALENATNPSDLKLLMEGIGD